MNPKIDAHFTCAEDNYRVFLIIGPIEEVLTCRPTSCFVQYCCCHEILQPGIQILQYSAVSEPVECSKDADLQQQHKKQTALQPS